MQNITAHRQGENATAHKNLSKDERLFVVDGVQTVGWNCACTELFADRVRRKSVHVHLDERTDLLVR